MMFQCIFSSDLSTDLGGGGTFIQVNMVDHFCEYYVFRYGTACRLWYLKPQHRMGEGLETFLR